VSAKPNDPAKDVELVYKAADAVLAAYKAVNLVPFAKRPALDTLLDGKVYPGDLDALSKSLKALADEWQGELDEVSLNAPAWVGDLG